MASFGFSAGDFLAAASLVAELIQALRGQASFEYRELIIELEGLQRALREIDRVQTNTDNEAAVNSIKVAALMCQYPIAEFQQKLNKYSTLEFGANQKKRDVALGIVRKAQWNIAMSEEVMKLRAYLAAHVGSINMRLQVMGLSTIIDLSNKYDRQYDDLNQAVIQVKKTADSTAVAVADNQAEVRGLRALLSGKVITQLQSLIDLVGRVWTANLEIMDVLTKMIESPRIDARHTNFQEQIRFEDAFGRVMPFPPEYGWSKLQAIILDQFAHGPGHAKVLAGEYELFDSTDTSMVISASSGVLRPGMAITMGIVIGRYKQLPKGPCPKPGCRSTCFKRPVTGGLICELCQTLFAPSHMPLQRPFRLLSTDTLQKEFDDALSHEPAKHLSQNRPYRIFKDMRDERKWFRNIRIHETDLDYALKVFDLRALDSASISSNTNSIPSHFRDFSSGTGEGAIVSGPGGPAIRRLMDVLCRETGLSRLELDQDHQTFVDVGIDSLLTFVILAALNEEFNEDFELTLFMRYPTIGEMKQYFSCRFRDEAEQLSQSLTVQDDYFE